MKKNLLLVFSLLLAGNSFAQFTKGNILVGGSTQAGLVFNTNKIKTGSTSTSDSKSTIFNIRPQAGYFVADNILIGSGLGIAVFSTKDQNNSNFKQSSTSLTLSPFARYYFSGLYGQVGFEGGVSKSKITTSGGTNEDTSNITGFNLAIGYPILLNESVALEPQLGYQTSTFKNTDSNVKSVNGGLFFSVGIYGYLTSLGKK